MYEFDSFKKKHYKTKKLKLKEDEIVQNAPTKELQSISYVVEKGDTLYAIARKFNISVAALKKQNNLESNDLEIGKIKKVSINAKPKWIALAGSPLNIPMLNQNGKGEAYQS